MSDWWTQSIPPIAGTSASALTGGEFTALHKHPVTSGSPVNAVAAALTTALTGSNNDMVFTANTKGASGNSITIAYVDPGVDTGSETVTVTGTAISVTLRSASSVLSTAAQVKTAVDANTTAHALVTLANAGGNDGTGHVTALTATALAGGVDGTTGTALELRADTSYLYLCTATNTIADANWRRISVGSAY